jgi:hypothetical protein
MRNLPWDLSFLALVSFKILVKDKKKDPRATTIALGFFVLYPCSKLVVGKRLLTSGAEFDSQQGYRYNPS